MRRRLTLALWVSCSYIDVDSSTLRGQPGPFFTGGERFVYVGNGRAEMSGAAMVVPNAKGLAITMTAAIWVTIHIA